MDISDVSGLNPLQPSIQIPNVSVALRVLAAERQQRYHHSK